MSQSRGSVDHGEDTEDVHEASRLASGQSKKSEDASDLKKSQAQRLLEFEMWTNDKAIKDLEYSQRRTEKKQRRRERRKHYQKRCWKKLYLPAVLGMVLGFFLTLCGTLQSLAGDTFLWNTRGALVIVGPVLLGLGFVGLMLAAGCTFKHDQEARQKPLHRSSDFLLHACRCERSTSRPSTTLRSMSVDTTDLPLPDDLNPTRSPATGRSGCSLTRSKDRSRSVSRDDSVHSGTLLLENSYSSTASWVHFVSAAHSQQLASLTRQNSDSNLLSSTHCQRPPIARRSLVDGSEVKVHSGSQSDLNVVCTRSWASSGYQSASDSTTGTVDYHVSYKNSQGIMNNSSYSPLRQYDRRSSSHVHKNTTVKEPKKIHRNRDILNGIHPQSPDFREGHTSLGPSRQRLSIPQTTPSSLRNSTSVSFSTPRVFPPKMRNLRKKAPLGETHSTEPRKDQKTALSTSDTFFRFPLLQHEETEHTEPHSPDPSEDLFPQCTQQPAHLEPQAYTVGSVRSTDL